MIEPLTRTTGKPIMKKVHRLPSAIIISSAVVVISWQLMLRPVVGLANNGDFGKVLGSFGLGAPREHEFRFADTKYDFDSRYFYKNGFFSSEFILVVPALALSAMLSRSGRFDLRHMGLIHGALFLLAIILFVRLLADLRRGAQYGLGLAVLFLFGDVAYVSYLNSFYMDVAAYLFMLLATVLYLRALRWRRRMDWVLLLISCFLLVTSKPQHAVLGFPLAMLFLTLKPGENSSLHSAPDPLCPVGCDVRARGRFRPGMAGRLSIPAGSS